MILVDDAGGAFPSINHSPWFGVTLADFVMPFFLFGVGVSISLVFKVYTITRICNSRVFAWVHTHAAILSASCVASILSGLHGVP